MDYLDCECTYFPSMSDDDPIMSAYTYAQRLGVREGFIPVLVNVDEGLWENIIGNSDPDSEARMITHSTGKKSMNSAEGCLRLLSWTGNPSLTS